MNKVQNMKLRWLLPLSLLLILVAGLIKTVFFAEEMNPYENRYAYQLPAFSGEAWLNRTFQTEVEDALGDQIPLAQTLKKNYNDTTGLFLYDVVQRLTAAGATGYIPFKTQYVYGDHLVFLPYTQERWQEDFLQRAQNDNQVFAAHPETTFYVYYIEKDTDIDFQSGEKIGAWDYLSACLSLPKEQMAYYPMNDYAAFREEFYQTDHHWNAVGSYRGYLALGELLGLTDMLSPLEMVDTGYMFSGAKAALCGAQSFWEEPFLAYRYAYPEMTVTINGQSALDYGAQGECFQHQLPEISYGTFYGGDEGEVVFDTGNTEKENLLVIGDSFDNAVLKLLASHYHRTYGVDLRYYEHYMGEPFSLGDYLAEQDISTVLLIGNIDFFILPEFMLED